MREFLENALTKSGYEALSKAAKLADIQEEVLFARTLLAWVELQGRFGYNQTLPHCNKTLVLTKNEVGYTGKLGDTTFTNASLEFVGANVAVALGQESFEVEASKALIPWGQNIDILVKACFLQPTLKKAAQSKPQLGRSAKPIAPAPALPPTGIQPKEVQKSPLGKQERSAVANQPLILKLSQFSKICKDCGEHLFKDQKWQGCFCLGDAKVIDKNGNKLLVPNKDLDSADWATIKAAVSG